MYFPGEGEYHIQVSEGGPIEEKSTRAGRKTSAVHTPIAYEVVGFGTLWFQIGHTSALSWERWSFKFDENLRIPVTGEVIKSTWVQGWWGHVPQPSFVFELKHAIERVLMGAIEK